MLCVGAHERLLVLFAPAKRGRFFFCVTRRREGDPLPIPRELSVWFIDWAGPNIRLK